VVSDLRRGVVSVVRYDDGADAVGTPVSDVGLPVEMLDLIDVSDTSAGLSVEEQRRTGASRARGQYLAFVPASLVLPPGVLRELVRTLDRHVTVGAVAPAPHPSPRWARVLAAPRGLVVVRTSAWREIGGFAAEAGVLDDLDFGWRLNVAGYDVVIRGDVVVPPTVPPAAPEGLAFSIVAARCLDGDAFSQVLSALRPAAGHLAAGSLAAARASAHLVRRRSDAELWPLIGPVLQNDLDWSWDPDGLKRTGGDRFFARRRKILVVTGDTLGERMAGPAIRAWAIASALAAEHDVVLAVLGACTLSSDRFRAQHVSRKELRSLEAWCDVLLFQGHLLSVEPWLADSDKILVADIYDPLHLEVLEQDRAQPSAERNVSLTRAVETVNEQLRRADFFLCASAKQRDFWLGHLASLGRLNPATYDGDENLDQLIAIAPFGLETSRPAHDRPAIKGVVPGIGPEDKVVLWGGGIYNWFDPLTLIRAIGLVKEEIPEVRLYFLGVKHPNPAVPAMQMAVAAQELAEELDLLGTYVFFNTAWVPYGDRHNFLLEADVGVSCHFSHVETAFSFRTRILDYLWASLPIVTTEGDAFGDLVTAEHLGVAVPAEDVPALAAALTKTLSDPEFAAACRGRVAEVADRFTWDNALAPLLAFCRAPHVARDRIAASPPDPGADLRNPPRNWAAEVDLARRYFAAGGIREVAARATGRLARILKG